MPLPPDTGTGTGEVGGGSPGIAPVAVLLLALGAIVGLAEAVVIMRGSRTGD